MTSCAGRIEAFILQRNVVATELNLQPDRFPDHSEGRRRRASLPAGRCLRLTLTIVLAEDGFTFAPEENFPCLLKLGNSCPLEDILFPVFRLLSIFSTAPE